MITEQEKEDTAEVLTVVSEAKLNVAKSLPNTSKREQSDLVMIHLAAQIVALRDMLGQKRSAAS